MARREAGLSQAQLARRVGCGQQYVSGIERGAYPISLLTMVRFVSALGLELRIGIVPPRDQQA
jgi:transcriptional regulator with XRE-family HTH domain